MATKPHKPARPLGEIGYRLRCLRQASEHSQPTFSKLLDVPQPTLSRWELGASAPPLDVAIRIGARLGLDPVAFIDYLATGDVAGLPRSIRHKLPQNVASPSVAKRGRD